LCTLVSDSGQMKLGFCLCEPRRRPFSPECRKSYRHPRDFRFRGVILFDHVGVTNERTQFYHVTSQLDKKYVAEVDDIINSPPQHELYTALKMELVKRLCPSKDQRTRQLFEFEEMGDRKPLQFLRHLRSLAPDIPADYLQIIWTSRLPPNIRTILAGLPEVELDGAALCADRIMKTGEPTTPCRLNSWGRGPSTHWIEGWVGPTTGLDPIRFT
jgi:hypothetical protein